MMEEIDPKDVLFYPSGNENIDRATAYLVSKYPVKEEEAIILCILADYDLKKIDKVGRDLLEKGKSYSQVRQDLYKGKYEEV